MRPSYIVIHHSLTKDSETVSWDAIRKYHRDTLGWRDIGYHYGIELIGDTYEILVGRLMNEIGAHCKEDAMNYKSLGICCIGNFDEMLPPESQWEKCVVLVKSLCDAYRIPVSHVIGHREKATYKSCPGKQWNMDLFRMYVED